MSPGAKRCFLPLMIAGSVIVAAQPAQFEVASVKVHTSDDHGLYMVAQPNGRFVAVNIPLRLLIRSAYQLQDDQIIGGPDWLPTARFDIDARAPQAAVATLYSQLGDMLRTLLADRFRLTTHPDKRELPVFALVRTRRDGSLGPGLRPTACPDFTIDLTRPQPCTNIRTGAASLTVRGMPFNQFTPYLAPYVNRVIVDRTGLDGRYDVDLMWTPESAPQARGGGEPAVADPNAVSIFTALQEQLGLKLDSTRATVDVLVIDTLERPTPN